MKLILTNSQRTRYMAALIEGWLQPASTILDLGTGRGYLAHYLLACGQVVTPMDVRDSVRAPGIKPIIYDGLHLPASSQRFDYCLLSTVLHHTLQPEALLREAARVSRRLIVIEDIYSSAFSRWITMASCSLANWQFHGHPHSNKSDAGWRETFGALGLQLLDARYAAMLNYVLPFSHAAYLLRPCKAR
ncbi:MAG: class I SAM-dependent methyltransferase [Anaerolineae bacterium]